jgi:hypothetical protein
LPKLQGHRKPAYGHHEVATLEAIAGHVKQMQKVIEGLAQEAG